ncbi:MAG: DUF4178 domain-containing protein [Candidatus Sericytochromatia bacterium]|nr:DUF4178 domain-containing protein [Candidatus Sericytochromatia bacterium]
MGFWEWLMGTPPDQPAAPVRRVGGASEAQRRASVFGLLPGDVVSYDEHDYIVKNKITYEEDGFVWYDYLLVDDTRDKELWLSAEDDDGVSIGIFEEIELDTIPPVPRQIEHQGVRYRQTEHSEASVQMEREDPSRDTVGGRVEYWDFEGPQDRYMSVLRWGGTHEASVGKEISEHELTIYPREHA